MSTTLQNPSDLSALTEEDGRLLHNFFALHQDIFRLAEHEKRPLFQLLAWIAQPRIEAAVQKLTQLEEAAHRSAALDHLRDIADATEDQAERRRAASTMLRALAGMPVRGRGTPAAGRDASERRQADQAAVRHAPASTPQQGDAPSPSTQERLPAPPDHTDSGGGSDIDDAERAARHILESRPGEARESKSPAEPGTPTDQVPPPTSPATGAQPPGGRAHPSP